MNSYRSFLNSVPPEGNPAHFTSDLALHGLGSRPFTPSSPNSICQRGDLGLHSWHWPALEPGPSNQAFGGPAAAPTSLKQARLRSQLRTSHIASQSMPDLPPVGCDPDDLGHHFDQRSSPTLNCLYPSPSCYSSRWEPGQPYSGLSKKKSLLGGTLCNGPEPGFAQLDDPSSSPPDWQRKSLLASPFSEDSDSDDGLSPSPFSSPESSNASDDVDEERSPPAFFSSTSPSDDSRYQHLDEYPRLLHDSPDDAHGELPALDLSSLGLTPTSPPTLLGFGPHVEADPSLPNGPSDEWDLPPLSPLDNHSSIDLGLQSPSLRSSSLPLFNSFPYSSYYDMSSPVPESPHQHSSDLPTLENEPHLHSESLGLSSGLVSDIDTPISPLSFGGSYQGHQFATQSGYPQRTTWLSLPGADTDDDLIPADLASKNYIPDPSIAISTTPPSRSLLIWDPNTRSGLPPGIPTFDGTGRPLSHRVFVNDMISAGSTSPDDVFEVDPAVVAELKKQDAEKGQEAQKICELRQRTTMAAMTAAAIAASKSGNKEGAQWEAERVRERWRELTALLRLKLKSEGKKSDSSGSTSSLQLDHSTQDGVQAPSSSDLVEMKPSASSNRSSSLPTSILAPIMESVDAPLDTSSSSPTFSPPQRRSSKPKITSMAQLVANMVLHRQQEAVRRPPSRGRTWPLPSAAPQTSSTAAKKSPVHATPKSPLSQMVLPDDVEDEPEVVEGESESPLQLSPLCLGMCQSPESLYSCLEAHPTNPLAGLEG